MESWLVTLRRDNILGDIDWKPQEAQMEWEKYSQIRGGIKSEMKIVKAYIKIAMISFSENRYYALMWSKFFHWFLAICKWPARLSLAWLGSAQLSSSQHKQIDWLLKFKIGFQNYNLESLWIFFPICFPTQSKLLHQPCCNIQIWHGNLQHNFWAL